MPGKTVMSTGATHKSVAPEMMADLSHRLGDIRPERMLMRPPPGTATEQDSANC